MGGYDDYVVRPIDLFKKQDEPVEGILTGSREIEGKYGKQTIWQFRNPKDGMQFEIYNFTNLGRTLETVPIGTQLEMTYTGMSKEKVKTRVGDAYVHEVRVRVYSPSNEEEKAALLEKHLGAEPLNEKPKSATNPAPAISKQAENLGQHSTLFYDFLKGIEDASTKQSLARLVNDNLSPRASELTDDDKDTLNKNVEKRFAVLHEKELRGDLPF